jgi:hypothetical protein
MISFVREYRELGALNHWVDKRGLTVKDAVDSLGKFIDQAKRNHQGEPKPLKIGEPVY